MLKKNEIIEADESIQRLFIEEKRNFLRLGLMCEYAHDKKLKELGILFEKPSDKFSAYDRRINDIYFDDKVALLNDYGNLSTTHSLSIWEYDFWNLQLKLGNRVILNSFEQIDDAKFLFQGQLDFSKLIPHIHLSQYDERYFFFNRKMAYLYASI